LPSEFIIRRVYFRALKMVFKSNMLPLSSPSILADNSREKVTLEQGEVGEIADLRCLDVHEVFQPPVLLGVPKVKLDLEPQRVVLDQGLPGQGQVIAKQQHLRAPPCLQVIFHDDDDIEQFGEVLVPCLRLVDTGPDVLFHCVRFHVRTLQRFQRQPLAVFAPLAFARIPARVGEVKLGVMAQFGDQMQPRLRNRLQAGIVPQCAVVHDTTRLKPTPTSFNTARMQPCNCVWNGDSSTSFLFLLTLPLGLPRLVRFSLTAFGALSRTSSRISCSVIKG